jgi:adenosine kinase
MNSTAFLRPLCSSPVGRIAVSGSVAFDTIMRFDGRYGDHILPEHTHRISVAFLVQDVERRRGGTAANIAYTLALLGERPLLCAAVGAADFTEYGESLRRRGVDTSAVLHCDDVGTASAFITTDADGNQITMFYAGAMDRATGVDLTALLDVSEVVVGADASAAMAAHCEQAASLGARLLFAPAQQIPAMSDAALRNGLSRAWCIVGNDYELTMIRERTGLSIDDLRSHSLVARTLGSDGSELHTQDGVVTIPAAPVERFTDPTGAGDAYIAGLLHGLRRGLPPEVAGRLGSLAAAWCVEAQGPQEHSFSTEEFAARFERAFGAPLPAA